MKTKTPTQSSEFNLGDRIIDDLRGGGQLGVRIEDVKEFIKILKEEIRKFDFGEIQESEIIEEIDKLAGDKLK